MKKIYRFFLIALAGIISLDSFSKDIQFLKPADKKKLFSYDDLMNRRSRNEFNLGAGLFYHIYGGGSGFKSLGLSLVGEYGTEQLAYRGSFNYGFPKTYSYEVTGSALSSATVPQYVTTTGKDKIGIMSFAFDGKKIFGGNDYSDGGFYGFIGVGLSIATVSSKLDNASGAYQYNYTEGKESFSQFLLRGGVGYDVRLDFGAIFAEAILNLPANQVNGVGVSIEIPASFGIQAGLRIPLGG